MRALKMFLSLGLGLLLAASAAMAAAPAAKKNPVVAMETTLGTIQIELYPDAAPATVRNFLGYVRAKHYDGLLFHRVIPGFMIQGGGLFADMSEKPVGPPIKNEAGSALKNDRGAVAMARTQVVDSATAQFFINVKNNDFLNHRDETAAGFGYAVFGKVIQGMEVVDKIAAVPTLTKGRFENVPADPVVIRSARILEDKPAAPKP